MKKSERQTLHQHVGEARERALDWLSREEWRNLRLNPTQRELVQRGLDDVIPVFQEGHAAHTYISKDYRLPFGADFQGTDHAIWLEADQADNTRFMLNRSYRGEDLAGGLAMFAGYTPLSYLSEGSGLIIYHGFKEELDLDKPDDIALSLIPGIVAKNTVVNRVRRDLTPSLLMTVQGSWRSEHKMELDVTTDPDSQNQMVTSFRRFPQPVGYTIFAEQPEVSTHAKASQTGLVRALKPIQEGASACSVRARRGIRVAR